MTASAASWPLGREQPRGELCASLPVASRSVAFSGGPLSRRPRELHGVAPLAIRAGGERHLQPWRPCGRAPALSEPWLVVPVVSSVGVVSVGVRLRRLHGGVGTAGRSTSTFASSKIRMPDWVQTAATTPLCRIKTRVVAVSRFRTRKHGRSANVECSVETLVSVPNVTGVAAPGGLRPRCAS